MRRIHTFTIALALTCLFSTVTWAERSQPREQAQQSFQRGVGLIEQERWEEALEEFNRSFRIYPTQAALFNRALCLRLMRRYSEALDTLEEYRRRYSDQVPESRMAEVEAELHTIRGLVGRISIILEGVAEADIYIDGRRVGIAPTFRPLVVAPGRHRLEVRAPGHSIYRQELTLSSGDEISVRATLSESQGQSTIVVNANVEGANVSLDGTGIGTTPLDEPIETSPGSHVIEVSREGYETGRVELNLENGEQGMAEVTLMPLEQLPPGASGQVAISVDQEGAQTFIDGNAYSGGPLPAGEHRLEVRLEGYETHAEEIEVRAGETVQVNVELVASVGEIDEPRGGSQPLRIAGYVAAGIGVAALGAGIGLLAWNGGRYSDWEVQRSAIEADWSSYLNDPDSAVDPQELAQRTNSNNTEIDSIQGLDVASWVVLGFGIAAICASVPLIVLGLRDDSSNEARSFPRFSFAASSDGFMFGASFRFR